MNPAEIITLIKTGKAAYKIGKYGLFDNVVHGGKDRVGEVKIRDSSYCLWEVKVRETGKRGRYLKISSKLSDEEILASAEGYKPGKYMSITQDEWTVFALCTENDNPQLISCAQNILDRLVR